MKTEAIVLNVLPFQEAHQIATLFTQDRGLCRAIGSYSKSPKSPLFGILSPLNHIEVIFRPSRGDLLKIETLSLLNSHPEMRKEYDLLHTACLMLKCVKDSQLPHKPAPLLFELLKCYLTLLEGAKSKEAVLASLQLKLLRHEGVIAVTNRCGICGQEPHAIGIEEGKTVCASHSANPLTEEETPYFYALALGTSVQLLRDLEIPVTLPEKIATLFAERTL